MSDALRIDLALAHAAGLPSRSANDASGPRDSAPATASSSSDPMFSPLALLLMRFLPPPGMPAPTPTPEEAHLLLAYLQQRVTAVLQVAGITVPASMHVSVDTEGTLRLTPAPAESTRVASLLRQDADVTRLADVLRRPTQAMHDAVATSHLDGAIASLTPGSPRVESAPRRVLPWPWFADASPEYRAHGAPRIALPLLVEAALGVGVLAALLLGLWLLS